MRQLQKQIVLGVLCAMIALIAASAAIGFLCLGLFFYFVTLMSAAWAAALTATVILAAAALIIFGLRAISGRRAAPRSQGANINAGATAEQLGNVLGQEARQFAAQHPGATVLGSLALGFMIGVSPGLRDLLRRGL